MAFFPAIVTQFTLQSYGTAVTRALQSDLNNST